MVAPIEYRFKINAYTPATMPLDRLAKYLQLLASLLGHPKSVHLLRVDGGSTMPVLTVDWEDDARVRQRAHDAEQNVGPEDAITAKRSLEEYLAQDNADGATLERAGVRVLQFRARGREPKPLQQFGPLDQPGTLDGYVARVGSEVLTVDPIPVLLRGLEGNLWVCRAPEETARKLLLYWKGAPVRVSGVGRWLRHPDGQWELTQFSIADFLELRTDSLSDVVRRMRNIPGAWKSSEDPVGEMMRLRDDSDE